MSEKDIFPAVSDEVVTATVPDDDTEDSLTVVLSFKNCVAVAYALNVASSIEIDPIVVAEFKNAAQVIMDAVDEQKINPKGE